MWPESTGVQTEKRETKPKKGKQSPERVLYVETDTRPCKELHSLIEKLLFWVHIDTADWQYQLKRGAFIMVESVLTISNFWPVGCTGVSEHGLINRLRDQTAWYIEWRSRASFEVQDKEKWTLAPSSVRWQNPIVPATEIRLLASAAKVHRCVCLFTVTGQQKICPEWSGLDS